MNLNLKLSVILLFTCCYFYIFSQNEIDSEEQESISNFIKLVKEKNKTELSKQVIYPLYRENPLPSIKNEKDFIRNFDVIFDDSLVNIISKSNPQVNWAEVGWRGIMLENGIIWLETDGRLRAVNLQSKAEKKKKDSLLKLLKSNLHISIRDFENSITIIETSKYRIRIDKLKNGNYRYSSWNIKNKMSDKPDLVLDNGKINFEGSGGNHNFTFTNLDYKYTVYITVIGDGSEYNSILSISKGDKEILNQNGKEISN